MSQQFEAALRWQPRPRGSCRRISGTQLEPSPPVGPQLPHARQPARRRSEAEWHRECRRPQAGTQPLARPAQCLCAHRTPLHEEVTGLRGSGHWRAPDILEALQSLRCAPLALPHGSECHPCHLVPQVEHRAAQGPLWLLLDRPQLQNKAVIVAHYLVPQGVPELEPGAPRSDLDLPLPTSAMGSPQLGQLRHNLLRGLSTYPEPGDDPTRPPNGEMCGHTNWLHPLPLWPSKAPEHLRQSPLARLHGGACPRPGRQWLRPRGLTPISAEPQSARFWRQGAMASCPLHL